MKRLKIASIIFLFLVGVISVYEYLAVRDAQRRTAQLFAPFLSANFKGLTWERLTHRQQQVLLKVEDPSFFTHDGLDYETKGAGLEEDDAI